MTTPTTPTGIPITLCETCEHTHPQNRDHCDECGRASLFLSDGLCLLCRPGGAAA